MPARCVRRLAAVVAFAALAAGCAPRTTVILLPEPDGKKTAVSLTDSRGEVVLDQPYAAVERGAFQTKPYTATPGEVQAKFGAALAAQPRREEKFTLHFAEGKGELGGEVGVGQGETLFRGQGHDVGQEFQAVYALVLRIAVREVAAQVPGADGPQ